jgi:hypothetical protein
MGYQVGGLIDVSEEIHRKFGTLLGAYSLNIPLDNSKLL